MLLHPLLDGSLDALMDALMDALLDPLLDALSDELVQLWWIQIHIVPHKASNNRRDPLPIRRKLNES